MFGVFPLRQLKKVFSSSVKELKSIFFESKVSYQNNSIALHELRIVMSTRVILVTVSCFHFFSMILLYQLVL